MLSEEAAGSNFGGGGLAAPRHTNACLGHRECIKYVTWLKPKKLQVKAICGKRKTHTCSWVWGLSWPRPPAELARLAVSRKMEVDTCVEKKFWG